MSRVQVRPLGPPVITARAILRERIAARIERLVAILDAMDVDPDHEDDGTSEPSLGWTKTGAWGGLDDLEEGALAVSEPA